MNLSSRTIKPAPELAFQLVTTPWSSPSRASSDFVGVRGHIVTDQSVDRIEFVGGLEALPLVDERRGKGSKRSRVWELPLPSGRSDEMNDSVHEVVELLARVGNRSEHIRLTLAGGIPSPVSDADELEPEDQTVWSRLASKSDEFIGKHIDVMYELGEARTLNDALGWSGKVDQLIVCDLARTVEMWKASEDRDEPRMALIVKLANDLRKLLPDICERPRVVLNRERQQLRIDRVQQVDATCLRWIARQPGRSVTEKAGAKQMVMGITRVEHADTPENRVVRDFLHRAIIAAAAYVREYRTTKFADHPRVTLVKQFRHTMRRLLKHTPIGQVRPLVGVATANYVLQHDPRYSILWAAYQRLVRRQTTKDNVWRWRHRVWSESCMLATIACLFENSTDVHRIRCDLFMHSDPMAGQFIDWQRTYLSPMVGTRGLRIHVLTGREQLAEFTSRHLKHRVELPAPSLVLLADQNGTTRCVPIWCQYHFGLQLPLAKVIPSLDIAFSKSDLSILPVVVVPHQEGVSPDTLARYSNVTVVQFDTSTQRETTQLWKHLEPLLERGDK